MAPQKIDLAGKVALVSGASRGVGRQIALRLAEHGAAVALVARNDQVLEELAQLIRAGGGQAGVFSVDLRQVSSVYELKTRVQSQVGGPSILVNCAGVFGPIQLIRDVDPQAWIDTLMVNTLSAFALCQAFVEGMIQNGWGRIVNVSSAASLHPPFAYSSAYVTSKVALNQLTRHLAVELEGTGVTANVIHPGEVKTEMWAYIRDSAAQLGPGGEGFLNWARWVDETGGDDPEKAARLVLNLVSDQAAAVNGQFLWIEDGLHPPLPAWAGPEVRLPWNE